MGDRDSNIPKAPQPPSISVTEIVDAADDLGPRSKLRKALIVLAQKIDKGFGAVHLFLTMMRQNVSGMAKTQAEHTKALEDIKDQLKALQNWRAHLEGREKEAGDPTGRHEIAKVLARDEIIQEKKKEEHEWRKASVPIKTAVVSGIFASIAAVIALITALLK
jgi:uncharacterized protein involved in exopolysaccharide biosynthesis